ncbi:hypothetical protein, partial [Zunongwangia atlantica]|uniref:hypothetical protein n=1 Tax=Zunongwangia atlantica TaxID=1502297 RepID=UPI001C395588
LRQTAVASNAMRISNYIYIFLIFPIGLFGQKEKISADIEFLVGEWISDSINPEPKHWREFIFIDNNRNFTKTSWWSNSYILQNNLILKDGKIIQKGSIIYQIKIIDSNTIEFENANYYGRFKRDPFGGYKESLKRFITGQKTKEELIGKWKYQNSEIIEEEKNKDYPEGVIENYRLRDLLHYNLPNILIEFAKDNRLKIEFGPKLEEYSYIIDDESISLQKSDYVINFDYEFSNGVLNIIDNKHGIKREIEFQKISD